jgi:flagellar basal-body rod protein FlgG
MEQVIDFSSGPMQKTENSLDVAIVGKGFFEVMTKTGPQYTRSGSFSVNTDGYLATSDGSPIMGQGSTIRIDGSSIEFSDTGEVVVDGKVVDRLKVVDFPHPYELQKIGDARFIPKKFNQNPSEAQDFTITQGFVEASNVDAVRTMTELIETMRAFESYQRVIRFADDALSKAVNEVGRTA